MVFLHQAPVARRVDDWDGEEASVLDRQSQRAALRGSGPRHAKTPHQNYFRQAEGKCLVTNEKNSIDFPPLCSCGISAMIPRCDWDRLCSNARSCQSLSNFGGGSLWGSARYAPAIVVIDGAIPRDFTRNCQKEPLPHRAPQHPLLSPIPLKCPTWSISRGCKAPSASFSLLSTRPSHCHTSGACLSLRHSRYMPACPAKFMLLTP